MRCGSLDAQRLQFAVRRFLAPQDSLIGQFPALTGCFGTVGFRQRESLVDICLIGYGDWLLPVGFTSPILEIVSILAVLS